MNRIISFFFLLGTTFIVFSQGRKGESYLNLPVIDLNDDTSRQVVVDKEDSQYLGHPTTVLLEDGKTILIVYPKGHGKGEIVYKKSFDGGLTWSNRLPVPDSWKSSREVPTIFRVIDGEGRKRLVLFSGLYPARTSLSEDDGLTWSELKDAGNWGGIVVMGCMFPVGNVNGNYMALFHDDLRFFSADGEKKYKDDRLNEKQRLFTLYKTVSADGGVTWGIPEPILSRRDMNLCEPGYIRSPDGKKIAVLLRENSRQSNSQIIFSEDEGKTWSEPRPLPNELTGDRHVLKYTPDGRILAVFRDISPIKSRVDLEKIAREKGEVNISKVAAETGSGSPTEGDWVGWVGNWDDLVNGGKGEYRIRFKDNFHSWDCCYPGVELLPDGTFVVTTYGHWEQGKEPYIICIRVSINELDLKFSKTLKQ